MKNKMKASASSVASAATGAPNNTSLKNTERDETLAADDSVQKTDRPGFDLGGSSGNMHAGTGLGLGVDASDTPRERRLPGRRLDSKLTIPRWSGPDMKSTTYAVEKTAAPESRSAQKTKKGS